MKQCRICFSNAKGIFLSPCNCKGTNKFVHLECFSEYLSKSNQILTPKCTICYQKFHLNSLVSISLLFKFLIKWKSVLFFIISFSVILSIVQMFFFQSQELHTSSVTLFLQSVALISTSILSTDVFNRRSDHVSEDSNLIFGTIGCLLLCLLSSTAVYLLQFVGIGYQILFSLVLTFVAASGSSTFKNQCTDNLCVDMINKLRFEKSPYLIQHASNPVHWYPWGEEAFKLARNLNRPIFLSIGYSTCHWCHVMQHESFENKHTANILNEKFVNIKVDRETLPDVDRFYMLYVQVSTGSGGWPLSIWLTPSLKPIYGGTYFPPKPTYGRASFENICLLISDSWKNDPQELIETSDRQFLKLKSFTSYIGQSTDFNPWNSVLTTFKTLEKRFDSLYGGFSDEPKFPTPGTLNFMATCYKSFKSFAYYESPGLPYSNKEFELLAEKSLNMVEITLSCIINGGIHDHIGGGFHRYSTDRKWHVPHFEKMLYDQAQLLSILSDTYKITKKRKYKDAIEDIIEYASRDLKSKSGGFYSAEDADSLPTHQDTSKKEGAFAVWSYSELNNILGKDCDLFCDLFGVLEQGNVSPDKDIQGELSGLNVLIQTNSIDAVLAKHMISVDDLEKIILECKKKLAIERNKRPRPGLDDKVITSWNALMISGLVQSYTALRNPLYLKFAIETAKFIKNNLYDSDNKTLFRFFREGRSHSGSADDYSFMINALIDIYQATFEQEWIEWAIELQATLEKSFMDSDGSFFSSVEDPHILLRLKDDNDGAEPSSNSIALKNLVRLGLITNDTNYETKARNLISSFSIRLQDYPQSLPQMLQAIMILERGKQVVLNEQVDKVHQEILRQEYLPEVVIITQKFPQSDVVGHVCSMKTKTCSDNKQTIEELFQALNL